MRTSWHGRLLALVVLPVLECQSPSTSREVQNSNDGNITKQRGEASEPTNHPPDTATLLGADWVRCPVLCAVKHLNVDPPDELCNEQMDPGLEMEQRPVAVSLCLPSSYNSNL